MPASAPPATLADYTSAGRLLLTAREAAQALRISERTLWTLTQTGEIPPVRIGRAVRYDIEDLREFIGKRKAGEYAGI